MLPFFDPLRQFTFGSLVLRLLLALASGGVIGYGRSKKNCAAGLRTYMLISLGAALSIAITLYEYQMLHSAWAETVAVVGEKFDASRLAAQAVTGIGFLGAGTILKVAHQQVKGLTTATGLFATVCIGIAAGIGFYELVIVCVVVIVLVLDFMPALDTAFKRRLRNISLYVEFYSIEDVNTVTDSLREHQVEVFDIDIGRTEITKDGQYPCASFTLRLSREDHSHSGILSSLAELPCVRSVRELIV